MKKIISVLLSMVIVVLSSGQAYTAEEVSTSPDKESVAVYDFKSLNDPALLSYVEEDLCAKIQEQLGDGYCVENVSATFVSKEYLAEIEYNSRANIYFGYTLDELDRAFEGKQYVFTLGDNGETIVKEFEEYDDSFDRIIKNVAIGSGVILICVTVSVVTGGLGAPAASFIFATSAKTAAAYAVSSGALSGVIAGVATGIQTQDMDEALKAAVLAGSENFKWGAITGAATGGALGAVTLKIASSGGLTASEAATIISQEKVPAQFVKQIESMDDYYRICDKCKELNWTMKQFSDFCMKTKYPVAIVEMFKSTEEGAIYYEEAALTAKTVGDKVALVRSIDLTYESVLNDGRVVTNLERMKEGYAALDPITGKAYELHHIGQSVDSPLAILTHAEHVSKANNSILHDVSIADGQGVHALLSDAEWTAQREEFWINLAKQFS